MRCAQQCGTRRFQSTTPLGRRHFFGNIVVFDIPISIHASARKATTDLRASCNDIRISIHASAREATIFRCPTPGHNHFNPRLREGGDLLGRMRADDRLISIHASAREATVSKTISASSLTISIHASAGEATRMHQTPC